MTNAGFHSEKHDLLCFQTKSLISVLAIDLAKATLLNSEELDSRLNKIGSIYEKKSKGRLEKYDSNIDVSMTERLVNRFSKRRKSNITQNSFDSSGFQSHAIPNNSIDHDTLHDKMAKIAMTSGEQDFNKIRKEAQ